MRKMRGWFRSPDEMGKFPRVSGTVVLNDFRSYGSLTFAIESHLYSHFIRLDVLAVKSYTPVELILDS